MMDNNDEWFYESIHRYKNLNMFELQYAVDCIQPGRSNSVVVSCSDQNLHHQLLELDLPPKTTSSASNGGPLTSDADLKIHCGTFIPSRVVNMRTCPKNNVVVTSYEYVGGVTVHVLPNDDSDQIENNFRVNCDMENPFFTLTDSEIVLTKNSTSPILFVNLEIRASVAKISIPKDGFNEQPVLPMYIEKNVIALCNCLSGTVKLYDKTSSTFINAITDTDKGDDGLSWSFTTWYESSVDPMSVGSGHVTRLAMISNNGDLKLYDTRHLKEPYFNERLDFKTIPSAPVQIMFHPSNNNCISVSGFDGNVYVHHIERERPRVIFNHDGHKHVDGFTADTYTTSHLWISNHENLIISSAQNKTVQLWQFENESL